MAGPSRATSSTRSRQGSKPFGAAGSSGRNKSSSTSRHGARNSRGTRIVSSRWRHWTAPAVLQGHSGQRLLLVALGLVILQAAVAVNTVYDETGWTKREWHRYKIDFDMNFGVDPAEEVSKSADLKKHLTETHLNSLHGPVKRKTVSKYTGMWARDDGSLVASPSEEAVEQAIEAVMCTTCHSLVSHVWGQLVWAINHADPISEGAVKELIEDACEAQVPHKVLSKYRVVQVEAPELDMSLFVVRERKGASSSSSSSSTSSKQQAGSKDGTVGSTAAAADGSKLVKDPTSSSSSGAAGGEDNAQIGKEAAAAIKETGGKDSSSSSSSSSSKEGGEAGQAKRVPLPADVTPAELEAVQQACSDLALHHMSTLQKQVWPKAKEYFRERSILAQKVLTKALWYNDDAFWEPDAYEDPDYDISPDTSLSMDTIKVKSARKLTPPDQLCLDMDIMCPYWASQAQCEANPAYMVGDKKHIGHCKFSCKACTQKTIWRKHPQVKIELKKAAAAAGQLLRTTACSASRACMAGGSSSIGTAAATKDTGSVLPGAVLAKTPGFVLGKPFWGKPTIRQDPSGGLSATQHTTGPAQQDDADEVLLSEGLGSQLLSVPGMDNFFTYQLEYKRRVYQFAKDADGKIKEDHILGTFDKKATAAAAQRDKLAAALNGEATQAWLAQQKLQQTANKHSGEAAGAEGEDGVSKPAAAAVVAPPMLELLDYLPDTESMVASYWPFMRQMYTGGEACMVGGRSVERQVELRAACSPDADEHMLVREPNFCRYVMVLYHPLLCDVDRLKPVPVLTSSSSSSSGAVGGKGKVSGLPGAAAGSKTAAAAVAAPSAKVKSAAHMKAVGAAASNGEKAAGSQTRVKDGDGDVAAATAAAAGRDSGSGSSSGSSSSSSRKDSESRSDRAKKQKLTTS